MAALSTAVYWKVLPFAPCRPVGIAMRTRRFLVLLFAAWLCAMVAALWSLERERLIFDIFCTVPNP
jgi:hypothetical protein